MALFEGTLDMAPDQPFRRTMAGPPPHQAVRVTLTHRGELLAEYSQEPPTTEITAVEAPTDSEGVPSGVALSQNHPNPFNTSTVIRFALSHTTEVELAVFSLTRQRIVTLVDGTCQAGQDASHWDGRDTEGRELASGIYLYRLRTGHLADTKRALLLQ